MAAGLSGEKSRRTRPATAAVVLPWPQAPKVVSDYLAHAGLTPYLDQLGINLVGYGLPTCINSGPLPEPI